MGGFFHHLRKYLRRRRRIEAGVNQPVNESPRLTGVQWTIVSIAAIGWRETWMAIGLLLAVLLVPVLLWLLKGHAARDRDLRDRLRGAATARQCPRTRAM